VHHQPARGRLDAQSFGLALKAALRQDPDVILVGEMRDLDTISTALTAAETGHLVFATLHTQSAPQTIDRIIDVFPAHQQDQVRVQLSSRSGRHDPAAAAHRRRRRPRRGLRGPRADPGRAQPHPRGQDAPDPVAMQTGSSVGMQTMDAALAALIRAGKITQRFAEQRSSTPRSCAACSGFGMAAA
jgi:twitching motility protein PilT